MNQDPQRGLCERPEPVDNPPDSRSNQSNEWIEELEKSAMETYPVNRPIGKGYLYKEHEIDFDPDNPTKIYANGRFTIEQLEALINHMRKHGSDKRDL